MQLPAIHLDRAAEANRNRNILKGCGFITPGTLTPLSSLPPSPPCTPPALDTADPFATTPAAPPASAATLTGTPLDHTWYPHIVDTIISFCSLATLRSFRGTSRRYRDHVTPLLYAHGLLERGDDGLYVRDVVSTQVLAVPLTRDGVPLLAHMTTLDIVGPSIPPAVSSFFSNAETRRLKTVRLRPDKYGRAAADFPPAATLVIFDDAELRALVPPKGLRKVVHARPSLRDAAVLNSLHREYAGHVPHVVFHFSGSGREEERMGGSEAPKQGRAFTLALALIMLLAASSKFGLRRRITIVGLDEVASAWLGLAASAVGTSSMDATTPPATPTFASARPLISTATTTSISTTTATLTDTFKAFVSSDTNEAVSNIRDLLLGTDAADMLAGVEYVSLDEYRKGVSAEELALETVM